MTLDSAATAARFAPFTRFGDTLACEAAKLGVHTRAQAVAEAYRIGLVNVDFEAHGLEREDDGGGSRRPPWPFPSRATVSPS